MIRTDDILVSVVIPTYARDVTLERAINCILAQTHQNLDIIVVDDNPIASEYRSSTERIMKRYESDARINYIQNKKNLGGAGARNVGIEAAKGEYIAFLDDDDEYYKEKIEKQLEVFLTSSSEKLALVYCDVEHLGKTGHVDCTIRKRHKGNCLYEAISDDCIASTSLWLVRKSALVDVEGFTIVPCKQDSTVILKLLEKGYEVDFVPEVLCKYYNFTGVIRISFGPRKVEGELLFREACRRNYKKFTKKQIRNIEYAFANRLYSLYRINKSEKIEELKAECKNMWRLRSFQTLWFFGKMRLKKAKKKLMKNFLLLSLSTMLLGCSFQSQNQSNTMDWINSSEMVGVDYIQTVSKEEDMEEYTKELVKTKITIDGSKFLQSDGNLFASISAIRNTMGLPAKKDIAKKTVTYDINTFFFDTNGLLCVNVKSIFNYESYRCEVVKSYYLYDQSLYSETESYDMTGLIKVENKEIYLPLIFLGNLYQFDTNWKPKGKSFDISGGGIASGNYDTKAYTPVTFSVQSGYYWSAVGKMTNVKAGLGEEYINQFGCTDIGDYIPVKGGEKYRFNFYFSWLNEVGGIVFLDEKDKLVSSFSYNTTTQLKNQIIIVPKNAVKMHLSVYINQKYQVEKVITIKGAKLSDISEEYYKEQSVAILEANQKEKLTRKKQDLKTDKAYITFILDDCRPDMDQIADIFEQKKIPLSIAAIYENLLYNTSQGKETRKEVCDRVVKNGGEILSHSAEVLTKELLMDYDTMFQHFYKDKWMLKSYGYEVNGIILAGGRGQVEGARVSDMWARENYLYSDLYGLKEYGVPYYHRRYWLANSKENYKKIISEAIENNKWIVFYMHGLNEVNAEKLNEILEYVNTLNEVEIEVTTYKNLYEKQMVSN